MFSPSRCSARALLQSPSLASWLWVSTFRFIFNNLKAFCWIEIIWLPSPLKNIPFLWHGKLLGCFCSIFWIICTVMCSPVSFAAFGWIWVQHCTFCPATSSSSHKITKHQWFGTIACTTTLSPDDRCVMCKCVLFSSDHFSTCSPFTCASHWLHYQWFALCWKSSLFPLKMCL